METSVRLTMWNNMDSSNCHEPAMDANAAVRITMCTLDGLAS